MPYQAIPPGILILLKDIYISRDYLAGKFKVPSKTIFNGISRYKNSKSLTWQSVKISTDTWIKYDGIPANTKRQYQLPGNDEILKYCTAQTANTENCEKRDLTEFIVMQLSVAIADYTRFIPYYRDAGLRQDRIASLAKTHALF